jgi:hypothetical protein
VIGGVADASSGCRSALVNGGPERGFTVEGVDPVVSYPVTGMNRVQLIWAGDGTWHDPGVLVFEWDLAHAVTVYRDGARIDSFAVGDPAKSTTSSRHVQKVCREYLRGGTEGIADARRRRRPAAEWRRGS